MKKRPRRIKTNAKRLREAADLLRAIAADGWQLYVAGSGSLHMMTGESHGRGAAGRPRRDLIRATEHVSTLSGGDW